jgi:phosphoglycerate dehydrogenase-like enzyme
MTQRHPVWFERAVLPDLVDHVRARAHILGPATADDPAAGVAAAAGVVAGGGGRYDAGFMDRAPHLRVIARTGIGVDRVDVAEATRRGIAVCNAPDAPTVSTAEHTLALIFAAAKGLKRSERRLRSGETNLYAGHDAIELDGKVLGLAGYGRIARRVAAGAVALGMRVIAHDPYLDAAEFGGTIPAASLDDLLAAADVVSVHIPLTPETRHVFDASRFAAMRDDSVFVNTARGGLVDQDALLGAIDSGKLLGAGLDVTDPEPLPPDHPLLHRDTVIVTPHVASGTRGGKRRLFLDAFDQVIQVLDRARPPHLVNPDVWNRLETTT